MLTNQNARTIQTILLDIDSRDLCLTTIMSPVRSLHGTSEIWILLLPSLPPKLTQLSILLKLVNTCVCWELTCDGLMSRPGGVKDSHPLNTTETGDERRLHGPLGSQRIQLAIIYITNTPIFVYEVVKMVAGFSFPSCRISMCCLCTSKFKFFSNVLSIEVLPFIPFWCNKLGNGNRCSNWLPLSNERRWSKTKSSLMFRRSLGPTLHFTALKWSVGPRPRAKNWQDQEQRTS